MAKIMKEGLTASQICVGYEETEMMQPLIDEGSDENATMPNHVTAVTLALIRSLSQTITLQRRLDAD
jgi:hypothetical protein